MREAKLGLHLCRRCREGIVRCRRAEDDQINVRGRDTRRRKRALAARTARSDVNSLSAAM